MATSRRVSLLRAFSIGGLYREGLHSGIYTMYCPNDAGKAGTELWMAWNVQGECVIEVDRDSGNVLRSWGSNTFYMPHGLTVDHNGFVWLTDVGLHQVRRKNHTTQHWPKIGALSKDLAALIGPTGLQVQPRGREADGVGESVGTRGWAGPLLQANPREHGSDSH
eukprot:scaffold63252_cov46-Prasinocladus_malaysianus.AAC.3